MQDTFWTNQSGRVSIPSSIEFPANRQKEADKMVALILFWVGVLTTVLLAVISFFTKGETKRGATFAPLSFLVAAAVAKYLGL